MLIANDFIQICQFQNHSPYPMKIPDVFYFQMCMDNASPRRTGCPAPEGGCRYVIWNPIGKWCNLAGEDCVMVDREVGERKTLIDIRAGMFTLSTVSNALLFKANLKFGLPLCE